MELDNPSNLIFHGTKQFMELNQTTRWCHPSILAHNHYGVAGNNENNEFTELINPWNLIFHGT